MKSFIGVMGLLGLFTVAQGMESEEDRQQHNLYCAVSNNWFLVKLAEYNASDKKIKDQKSCQKVQEKAVDSQNRSTRLRKIRMPRSRAKL